MYNNHTYKRAVAANTCCLLIFNIVFPELASLDVIFNCISFNIFEPSIAENSVEESFGDIRFLSSCHHVQSWHESDDIYPKT